MCAQKKSRTAKSKPDRTTDREKVMATLASLSPFETDILEVAALFYMPVKFSTMVKVLQERGARTDSGRAVTHPLLKGPVGELGKLGLLKVGGNAALCERSIVELVTRRMVAEQRFNITVPLVYSAFPYKESWSRSANFWSRDHAVAHTRLALYAQDFEGLEETLEDIYGSGVIGYSDEHPVSEIITNPFDPAWLGTFPLLEQSRWLCLLIEDVTTRCGEAPEVLTYIQDNLTVFEDDERGALRAVVSEMAFLRGQLDQTPAMPGDELYTNRTLMAARIEFVQGRPVEAVAAYEACLAMVKKVSKKRKPKFHTPDWLFFLVALVDAGEAYWPRALELATWGATEKGFRWAAPCQALVWLLEKELGMPSSAKSLSDPWRWQAWTLEQEILTKYFDLLFEYLTNRDGLKGMAGEMEALHARAGENGYRWLEAEFAELLHRSGASKGNYGPQAEALRESLGCRTLATVLKPAAEWERVLKALSKLGDGSDGQLGAQKQSRLVWTVVGDSDYLEVQPKEQKLNANGRWSKGRAVALRRLYHDAADLDFLTEQDRAACKHIQLDVNSGHWGRVEENYSLLTTALAALAGHPNVYWTESGDQVELVSATPELRVTKSKGSLTLELVPPKPRSSNVSIQRVGDTRLVVYQFSPEICRVAEVLGKGVRVPENAKGDVLAAVSHVSKMVTVHSDIGVGDDSIPTVEADASPIVQLLPSGDGLLVQLRVQPLKGGGPLFPPGSGGEAVMAEVNGARVQTERDLQAEERQAGAVVDSCATLSREAGWEGEWRLDDPESCLEFLTELEASSAPARVQWPKGQKYNIQGTAGMGQFRAKISGGHNWFELSGEVKIDTDLVLDMQRLLEFTSASKSRFVDLGNGQFVALTHAFRKKLDELRGMGETSDTGLRMHALAAPAMDDLVAQVASLKANKKWKEQAKKLQGARELEPEIPSTLRATLRDYQIDGFKWLARLAEWGVGACLADDMGLGKTVQILAVMLDRAAKGPQLVVAPTSVCMNWEDEATRFAPTLTVHRFGVAGREALLADLGPLDVVVTSYGLLQNESALFKEVAWQTIVLDEAQAIKNMATKRSKAAMDLNGAFKIVATGTPIENHLGELWNLYRFINPGFLGSLDHFNEKFALPIEKHQDKDTRHRLRQLIQPFLLRRLKGDVLDELPPRTDIVLHVELSKKERAFYEALRQQALKDLSDVKAEPGKHHVRILAELMRLRRACCNTQLVDENSTLPSAKLEVFEAVLEELMENRHKVLVFSQFVGHLGLIRALLDKKGLSYQYLDGSTSTKARKKAVEAFQAGEGDLFLISLKAGGVGLNLTAADYVIHMDPWWNPAVEDQASDRAHRIGQQRPVTVYRLVAKHTIEDQIVDLHHQKRDLANSLLEGSDMAGKVSAEQLLALIRGDAAGATSRED